MQDSLKKFRVDAKAGGKFSDMWDAIETHYNTCSDLRADMKEAYGLETTKHANKRKAGSDVTESSRPSNRSRLT